MEKYDKKDGVWRTIRGNRVFIRYNQSLSEALREKGYNLKKEDKKKKKESISDEYDVYEEENGYSGKGKELLRFLQFEEKDSGVEIPENLKKTLESNPDKEYIFNSNDNSLKDFKLDDSYIKGKGIRTNPDDYLGEGEFKNKVSANNQNANIEKLKNGEIITVGGKKDFSPSSFKYEDGKLYYKNGSISGNTWAEHPKGLEEISEHFNKMEQEGFSIKSEGKSEEKVGENDYAKQQEIRNAIRSSYIYRDEYKSDEYMKQYKEKYGEQSVNDAIKYYDDNYITVKGTSMDSEGLTYNNILKKDEYPKEALEKYSKDMKELYDREKYSYDSVNYNKKANDLYHELQNSKQNEKWNNNYRTKAINNEYALSFGDSSQNYSDTKSVSFKDKEKAVLNNEFLGDYYGKEQYEKYGDSVLNKYAGKQISKKISDSNNPNGLTTLAKETGMNNEYEAVKTLEGMVRNGKAREIDDSTYEVGDKKSSRTYEQVNKEWLDLADKMSKDYKEFGQTSYKNEKRLNELSNERDSLQINKTPKEVKNADKKYYQNNPSHSFNTKSTGYTGNGFTQQVMIDGGEYQFDNERLKRMEKLGKRPKAYSYTGGGWEGTKYNGTLTTKDIAKNVNDYSKKEFPGVKLNRKTDSRSVDFYVMSTPKDIYKSVADIDKMSDRELTDVLNSKIGGVSRFDSWLNKNNRKSAQGTYTSKDTRDYLKEELNINRNKKEQIARGNEWYLNDYGKKLVSGLNKEMNSYNYDDSDGMIDYFNTNFYGYVKIGKWDKPYEVSQPKSKAMNMSQLIQSYVDRGYSEETARKMAKQTINKRKKK